MRVGAGVAVAEAVAAGVAADAVRGEAVAGAGVPGSRGSPWMRKHWRMILTRTLTRDDSTREEKCVRNSFNSHIFNHTSLYTDGSSKREDRANN